MSDLSDLERRVLDAALRGKHPALLALREQAATCRISKREMTGVGFFTHLDVTGGGPRLRGSARISGVFAEVGGLRDGMGFLLIVENGQLTLLEGFTYEEEWAGNVRTFEVHERESEPDLSALEIIG